jgi:hypothetical protein
MDYLLFKTHVSETGFCLRLQVEPTHLAPLDRPVLFPSLRNAVFEITARTMDTVQNCDRQILICHRHILQVLTAE